MSSPVKRQEAQVMAQKAASWLRIQYQTFLGNTFKYEAHDQWHKIPACRCCPSVHTAVELRLKQELPYAFKYTKILGWSHHRLPSILTYLSMFGPFIKSGGINFAVEVSSSLFCTQALMTLYTVEMVLSTDDIAYPPVMTFNPNKPRNNKLCFINSPV